MSVVFKDNSAVTLSELERAVAASLESIGQQGVSHAKNTVTAAGRIGATGNLRGEINHMVVGNTVHVGTNTRYAIYHEMGTGIYIAGGRRSPWAYKDAEGQWHWTRGIRPIHMIKNSIANHVEEYKQIILRKLRGS